MVLIQAELAIVIILCCCKTPQIFAVEGTAWCTALVRSRWLGPRHSRGTWGFTSVLHTHTRQAGDGRGDCRGQTACRMPWGTRTSQPALLAPANSKHTAT